jgi:hypothetical protein
MSDTSPIATNSNNSHSDHDDTSYQHDVDTKLELLEARMDAKFDLINSRFDGLTHMISELIRTYAAGQGSIVSVAMTPDVVPPIALSVVPPAVLPVSHPVPGTTMHAQSTGQGSIVSVAMTPDVDQTPDRTSASLDGAAVHSPVATRHAAFMVSPRAGMGGNVIDDVVLVEFVESSLSARQFTSSTSSAFSHGGVGKPELFRCDYDVARVPRPGTASSTSQTSGGFVCVGVHECWTAESYR